jgi:hypothetical protein
MSNAKLRTVDCFRSFNRDSTMLDVVKGWGVPDKPLGSGFYILVYYMEDFTQASVATPDLQHLRISHSEPGRDEVLLDTWQSVAAAVTIVAATWDLSGV